MRRSPLGGFDLLPGRLPPCGDRILVAFGGGPGRPRTLKPIRCSSRVRRRWADSTDSPRIDLAIARVMGRSEGAAKLLKERALKKLRTLAVWAALTAHIAA